MYATFHHLLFSSNLCFISLPLTFLLSLYQAPKDATIHNLKFNILLEVVVKYAG